MPFPCKREDFRLDVRMFNSFDNSLRRLNPELTKPGGPIKLSFWTGLFDDSSDHIPIYTGDICEVELINEFGSARISKRLVAFDVDAQSILFLAGDKPILGPEQIGSARVIGNKYLDLETARQIMAGNDEKNQ